MKCNDGLEALVDGHADHIVAAVVDHGDRDGVASWWNERRNGVSEDVVVGASGTTAVAATNGGGENLASSGVDIHSAISLADVDVGGSLNLELGKLSLHDWPRSRSE